MNGKKILRTILTFAIGISAAIGLASCNDLEENTAPTKLEEVYAQYVAYAQEQSETPMSYEAWLETIKGDKGDKGDTGATGNGIEKIETDKEGNFIVYYTDGTTQTIPFLQQQHVHTFGEWKSLNEKPGYYLVSCEEKFYVRICAECNFVEGRWGEHTWQDELFTKEPTCTIDGGEYKICSTCNSYSDLINEKPATGHSWCETYQFDEFSHWTFCETCEAVQPQSQEVHTLDDKNECTVCKNEINGSKGVLYDVSLDGTYASVVGYTGISNYVRIADTYNGVPVTRIAKETFYNSNGGAAVSIPATITKIETKALVGIRDLYFRGDLEAWLGVEIESEVSYGHNLYLNNELLVDLIIPDTITEILAYNFYNCRSIKTITIPANVQSISESAFEACDYVTDLMIEEGVATIGKSAFSCCANLINVSLPNSITHIGDWAFALMPHQQSKEGLYTTYGNCKYLGNEQNPYLFLAGVVNKNLSSYVIHENTRFIGVEAFRDCASMSEIIIPDGVTSIGYDAFRNCTKLTSVVIGGIVTSIGDYAFCDCTKLTSVVIGANVTTLGDYAFVGCSSLTNVYYKGTKEAWTMLSANTYPYINKDAVYFYIENELELPNENGKYWYYDKNGEIVTIIKGNDD